MKSVKYVIAIIIIGVVGFFGWKYFKQPEIRAEREIKTVVAFGDSLVSGIGATEGNDLVSILSRKIRKPIINKGVSGNTSAQGLARIDEVVALQPDLVFVLLGGNDALQRISRQETFSNLDTIISTLQKNGAMVVLLGIQGGPLGDPFKSEFKTLANRYKLIYVPNVLEGLFGHSDLMYDAVHPNDAGYRKMADRVYEAVKSLF
ncbi:MAG: arylesterase [Candidatus Paceibacter sp.]|jgi:lysophospholipase L1-like esterase|nr:arylesterase [Candidatus Paceibacter sp.]